MTKVASGATVSSPSTTRARLGEPAARAVRTASCSRAYEAPGGETTTVPTSSDSSEIALCAYSAGR